MSIYKTMPGLSVDFQIIPVEQSFALATKGLKARIDYIQEYHAEAETLPTVLHPDFNTVEKRLLNH